MTTSTSRIRQSTSSGTSANGADALAPICDLNEQFLRMLVAASPVHRSSPDPFMRELVSLVDALDATALTAAARFPFLLVDFSFRDPEWWNEILAGDDGTLSDVAYLPPFPRDTAIALARAAIMLAWHTARTDTETTVVLLGITPEVAQTLNSLRLQDIDRIAERHFWRVRPRWADRPGVWRQLLTCAQSMEVQAAHDFVLHALQLTADASVPRSAGVGLFEPRPGAVTQKRVMAAPARPKRS